MQSGPHDTYLDEREFYLYLLELAQVDAICAPILIPQVQAVLDEDARYQSENRARLDKGL
jgi:hypothetical protein